MALTRTTTARLLKVIGIILLAGIIITYAIWRSLNYARGPEINVTEPANGVSVDSSTVLIRGQALRANDITLDGKSISVDEQGHFNEIIILFPGMNIVTLEAHDQFERTTKKVIYLVGTKDLPQTHIIPAAIPQPPATTSQSTTTSL